MNIKEQELIEQHLNEASSKDYSKLSTTELKDLLTIFKNVSRSAAKPVIGAINRELNTRVSEETRIEEAKVVPFKKLEQAWTRTNGDKAKQAKLIKKHDLKKLISTVRPGEIKLGVKNKLLGTTKAATAAGLDLDDQLIFITNNPLKIIYPKKSSRRPEGEEIKESVDVAAARLEKMVSLVLKENDLETIKFFIENSDIDLSTAPSKIREGYKTFINENRAIVSNPRNIKAFIKQAEKKFPQYKGEIEQAEDDEIVFPNDPKLIKFFKGAREVKFVLKDSVEESAAAQRKLKTSNKLSSKEYEKFSKLKAFNDKDWKWNSKEGLYNRVNEEVELDEAKNITVRALRQMMFKLDSSAADKLRKELFKVDAQDSPASNAQIKKGMKIAGNKFGKKDFTESIDLEEGKDDYIVVIQGAGDNNQKIIKVFKGTQLNQAKKYKDDWNKKNANKIKKNKKGQPMAAHGARLYNHPAGSTVNGKPNIPKVGDSASWSTFGNRVIKEELTDLDEASKSDIKKVLDAGKKAGGKIKGNTIDFGMGAKIDVSLEKGKIKLDGGRDGVELFKNVKDALMAFEETQQVMEEE